MGSADAGCGITVHAWRSSGGCERLRDTLNQLIRIQYPQRGKSKSTSQRKVITMTNGRRMMLSLLIAISAGITLHAQGTLADYQRGNDLQAKAHDLVVNLPGPMHWIGDSHHLWYA